MVMRHYLLIPPLLPKNSLCHKINWSYLPLDYSKISEEFLSRPDAISVLATWAQMPPFCRYCHADDHSLKDRQLRLKSIVCNLCHETGHIHKDCGRRNNSTVDQTKKRKTSSNKKSNAITGNQRSTTGGSPHSILSSAIGTSSIEPIAIEKPDSVSSSTNIISDINENEPVTFITNEASPPDLATGHINNNVPVTNSGMQLRSRYDLDVDNCPTVDDMSMGEVEAAGRPNATPEELTNLVDLKSKIICKHCGLVGHQRTTSNKCLMNPKNINNNQQLPSSGDPMEL